MNPNQPNQNQTNTTPLPLQENPVVTDEASNQPAVSNAPDTPAGDISQASTEATAPTPVINNQLIDAPLEEHEDAVAVGEVSALDTTKEVSEEGAKVLREQAKAKSLKYDVLPNMTAEEGINLIPTQSADEIKLEQRKSSFNLLSAVSILILVVVSVLILGFNVVTKLQLNAEKNELADLETLLLNEHASLLAANDEILNRFDLYQDIQETTTSPKEVLLYWEDLVTGFGELDTITISNGLRFEVAGSSRSLKETSFLWHLLTIDEKVSNTNLESLAKQADKSTYSFEGELDFEYFVNKNLNEGELADGDR